MPFDWVRDKISKLKKADSWLGLPRTEIMDDEAMPRRLRESLMSQDSEEADVGAEEDDDHDTKDESRAWNALTDEVSDVLTAVSDDEPSTITKEVSKVMSDNEQRSCFAGPCGNQNYEVTADETIKWNDPEVVIRLKKFVEFDFEEGRQQVPPAEYFTNNTTGDSEVFYSPKLHMSPSHMSLIRNVSSMSMLNSTGKNQNSSLTIERIVPLCNKAVIVHWNVNSFHGIQGYKVFVDGFFATKTFSSERTSALVKNVNSEEPHLFAVSIIPKEPDNMFKKNARKMNVAPAVFMHKPAR